MNLDWLEAKLRAEVDDDLSDGRQFYVEVSLEDYMMLVKELHPKVGYASLAADLEPGTVLVTTNADLKPGEITIDVR